MDFYFFDTYLFACHCEPVVYLTCLNNEHSFILYPTFILNFVFSKAERALSKAKM